MLDVAVSYNRYKFVGNEFLTWLWFAIETNTSELKLIIPEMTTLHIGNRVVLENRINNNNETITIKGDDADLKEGVLALAKGALVTELHLIYNSDSKEWVFALKGESLSLFNLKLPQTGPLESKDDLDGLFLEKAYLMDQLVQSIDKLYAAFIRHRLKTDWNQKIVPQIKDWIQQRSK